MTVTMISGARDTANILAVNKKVEMGNVHMLEDDKIKLTKLVSQISKRNVTNSTYKWMTDELNPKFDQLAEALDSSETGVDVDTGSYFRVNDLVKVVETGEVMLVTSISTNTLTVVRGSGSTAGTAAADNGQLLILGPAYAEGDTLEAARSTTEVEVTNYTQIFRHPFHLTGTEAKTGLYSGDEVTKQRGKKLLEHVRDINLTAYWGEKSSDIAGPTGIYRSTGGLYEFIPTANRDSVAVLTEAEFNDGLRSAFRYGSDTKVLFCSRKFAGIINEYMSNVQRVEPGDSKYGVKMMNYTSPHGELKVVTDIAIEGTEYDKYGFVVDIADCGQVCFQGRDTQLLLDRQATDEDGVKEEYLTETGFEWGNGSNHYVFNAVTS